MEGRVCVYVWVHMLVCVWPWVCNRPSPSGIWIHTNSHSCMHTHAPAGLHHSNHRATQRNNQREREWESEWWNSHIRYVYKRCLTAGMMRHITFNHNSEKVLVLSSTHIHTHSSVSRVSLVPSLIPSEALVLILYYWNWAVNAARTRRLYLAFRM